MPKAYWWWLIAVALASCTRAPAPPVAAPPEVAAPVSLDEVMRRTHFAFWPEGAGFVGGHDTYLARVDGQGLALHLGAETSATLRFASTTFGREEGEPQALAGLRRRQDGVLLREGLGVTEVLENTERGLEQSWRFERQPAGEGDLVVRVPVETGAAATVTEAGLRFTGPGGAFTYGHGTWVDAQGQRTPIPATFSGGAIVLRVPAEVLGRGGYPAVLDPLISPEVDVEPATSLPAWGNQDVPVVAFNGSVYLVAWQDSRLSGGLFATRVAEDGSVLDPWGISVGRLGTVGRPAIASNGADFFLAQSDGNDVRGARLDGAGQVLAPGVTVLAAAGWTPSVSLSQLDPALAWTGSEYVLVNVERRSDPNSGNVFAEDLVGRRLSSTGVLLSRVELTSFAGASSGSVVSPQLAIGNAMLVVAYRQSSNQVRALRFGLDLVPLDAAPAIVLASVTGHSVSWDGQRFVVVASVSTGLVAARVTTAGAVIDTTPLRFTTSPVTTFTSAPEPGGVTVAWAQAVNGVPSMFVARVAPTGALFNLGAPPVAINTGAQGSMALAWGRDASLFTWRASGPVQGDLYGVRLSDRLVALDQTPLRFSSSPARQQLPTLAWNGQHYLAAWLDYRVSQPAVYATRLSRDGTPVAPLATRLSAQNASSVNRPAVSSDGDGWLVVWSQSLVSGQDVLGARVAPNGEALDDAGVVLVANAGDQSLSSVAWLENEYLVVFEERPTSNAFTWDVLAVAVGRDGRPRTDGGLVISAAPNEQSAPRVAAYDGGALVAWYDRRDAGYQVRATRVAPGPRVLDADGLYLVGGSAVRGAPSVAAGSEGFFVCWTESFGSSVSGARVDHGGQLRGVDRLSVSGLSEPCVAAWDGEDFVVGWSQRPSGAAHSVLVARWVSFDGGLSPDAGLVITPDPDAGVSERISALASPGRRQVIVGFSAEVLPDAGLVARARTRVVTRGSPPVAAPASATTSEDVAVTVPLAASDPDGDAVVFVVAAQPDAGVAVAVDGGVSYQPAPDFHGTDRFLVRADDGALMSAPVEVEVVVTPVDDVPIATDLAVELNEDESVSVPVSARDVDGDALTFAVVQMPARGTLSGQPPAVVYAPAPDFSGSDSFTYTLSDGRGTSAPARVTVLVRPVDDAPVAVGTTVTTQEDTPVDVPLAAADADGDALTFEVLDAPAYGALEGTAPALRFVPAADFHGEDRLSFRVTDGTTAVTAEVRLVVEPVNDVPVAVDATLAAVAGAPLDFSLAGTDVEGDALSFQVLTGPAHGTLTGEAPALTYSPASDFDGEDELRFAVTDAAGASATGTVRFVVAGAAAPPSPSPPASCGCGAAGLELLVALAALLGRRRGVTRRCR